MHKTKDLYLTNRFYLAVHVQSGNTQTTSKRGKKISHATCLRLVLLYSYYLFPSSVLDQSTHARPNGIYLLNISPLCALLFLVWSIYSAESEDEGPSIKKQNSDDDFFIQDSSPSTGNNMQDRTLKLSY